MIIDQNHKKNWIPIYSGILLLVGLSWLKFSLTGNVRVDHNPFPAQWGYPVFILFIATIALIGYHYWQVIWNSSGTRINYKKEAYIIVILASLMLPFLSNDVIIYLGHGYLSNHGVDVFSNTSILKNSTWAPYIHDWIDGPFVYGPINLIPAKLANLMGGESLWLTFVAYKIFMVLIGFGIIELLQKIIDEPKDLLIAILAPSFWLHNIGHMHNDVIACLFTLASVYFILKQQLHLSVLFIGIALSCKVSVIMYVPFIFSFYFFTNTKRISNKIGKIFIALLLLGVSVIGCYAIFYKGITSLSVPFEYLSKQHPAKSFAEILGEILNVAFSGLNTTNIESEFSMESIPTEDPKVHWWAISKTIFNVIGIIMFVITGLVFAIKTKMKLNKELIIELFTKFSFIFFFFYLHIFQAWYLVLLLPLIVIGTNNRIKKYFMILCCYSGIHTIIITIARPSLLFYILPGLVIVNALLFLWQFRKNYLTVETLPIAGVGAK